MRKIIGIIMGCLLALSAVADEAEVRTRLKKVFPKIEIDSVERAPFDRDWYEVVIGNEPFYVDASGRYLMAGTVIELASKRNLTQERKDQLSRVDVKSLPLESAIKRVYGNGKQTLITFEDPYCGYCKKLIPEFKAVGNLTVYTFLYPVITPESLRLSKQIWCSRDRTKAWESWMSGVTPDLGTDACKNPIEANVELGHAQHIQSVPTIIFSDGSVMRGYRMAEEIKEKLSALKNARKKK